jgi:hypothetical protein
VRPKLKSKRSIVIRTKFCRIARTGRVWVYVFGKDKILGNNKLFIPNYGLFVRVRVLKINFDRDGRVTSWKTALVGFSKYLSPLRALMGAGAQNN